MGIIILVIVLLVAGFVVILYNGLVKLRNRVKEAWADIDVQLKRRYNLIPNLVETVKGYAAHESEVFQKVTEARTNAINATNVKDQGAAENMLSGALKSLFAVSENYPELKANENFGSLQNELVDTEDKIQSSRRFYNGNVRDYNTKIQQVPANIIAGIFKFQAEEFFEIENEEERENVQVSFSDDAAKGAAAQAATEQPAEEPAPAPAAEETPVAETETDTATVEPTEAPVAEAEPQPEAAPEIPETPEASEPAPEQPAEPAEEPEVAETPAEPEPTPEPEAPAEEVAEETTEKTTEEPPVAPAETDTATVEAPAPEAEATETTEEKAEDEEKPAA